MSLMLDRDYATESEHGEKQSFGRMAARVVLLSVLVTALIAGLYMAFGGNDKTDPLATGTTTQQPAAGTVKTTPAKPKPLTYEQKVAAAAAKLPTGTLSTAAKRAALIKYLGAVDIKITANSSPATAAGQACTLMGQGKSANEMVNGIASGGGYSKQQAKAFMLGASTLYCPTYAKNFK